MTLAGCLFDMDGLLLDTERAGMGVFVGLLDRAGIDGAAARALYLRMIGTSGAESRRLVADVAPHVDGAVLERDWVAGLEALMATQVPLRPTVRETLASLAAQGVPMSVVTNTRTARAEHHLEVAGLSAYFVAVIGSEPGRAPKPDPAPYLAGAASLGLIPETCAAFEDSDTGTRAAIAAGCQTWQIPDLRPEDRPILQLGQGVASTLAEAVRAAGWPTLAA